MKKKKKLMKSKKDEKKNLFDIKPKYQPKQTLEEDLDLFNLDDEFSKILENAEKKEIPQKKETSTKKTAPLLPNRTQKKAPPLPQRTNENIKEKPNTTTVNDLSKKVSSIEITKKPTGPGRPKKNIEEIDITAYIKESQQKTKKGLFE